MSTTIVGSIERQCGPLLVGQRVALHGHMVLVAVAVRYGSERQNNIFPLYMHREVTKKCVIEIFVQLDTLLRLGIEGAMRSGAWGTRML